MLETDFGIVFLKKGFKQTCFLWIFRNHELTVEPVIFGVACEYPWFKKSSDWLISLIKFERFDWLQWHFPAGPDFVGILQNILWFSFAFTTCDKQINVDVWNDILTDPDSVSSLSAPLQVQRSAGQLWHVSAGGQEVPVWLV